MYVYKIPPKTQYTIKLSKRVNKMKLIDEITGALKRKNGLTVSRLAVEILGYTKCYEILQDEIMDMEFSF